MTAPVLGTYTNGVAAVTGDQFNTFCQTCNNVNDLRGFIGVTGVQVFMRGYTSVADGGQGEFYWNASSTATDDGGVTTIAPSGATTGRWIRIPLAANPLITPLIIGGVNSNSSLTLESTSVTGSGDAIYFKTGTQQTAMSISKATNAFVPDTGAQPGSVFILSGSATAYSTPGIGPAPSTGNLFVNSNYADSGSGNISNIFAVASNSGTRYAAGMTGIGFLPAGTVGGNVWGGQFSAVAQTTANGILQGANIEADIGTNTSSQAIALTLKIGDSTGTQTVNNPSANSYINMLADAHVAPALGFRFQDTISGKSPIASTGRILGGDSGGGTSYLSCAYGIDLRSMTFSSAAYASPGFSVSPSGKVGCTTLESVDNNGTTAFKVINNGAGTGGSYVQFFPGDYLTNQNPEFQAIAGGSATCGISFRGTGNWFHAFHAPLDGSAPAKVALYQKADESNAVKIVAPYSGLASTYEVVLPNVLGGKGGILALADASGTLSFTTVVANGTATVTISNLAPAAVTTATIAKWLKIPDATATGGYVYVPAWAP